LCIVNFSVTGGYAGGSVATGRGTQDGQASEKGPGKELSTTRNMKGSLVVSHPP